MTLQATVTDLYQRASAAGMFDAPYRPATPAAARRFAAISAEAHALLTKFFPTAASSTPSFAAPAHPEGLNCQGGLPPARIKSLPPIQNPEPRTQNPISPYYDLLHRLAHSRPA